MDTLESTLPNQLVFTERAVEQTHTLMAQKENENPYLRLFIVGSGCAGLQYGFAFDENKNPGDTVISKTIDLPDKKQFSIAFIIDPISFLYLNTATVDYHDGRFTVDNPNVKTTCGCPGRQTTEN